MENLKKDKIKAVVVEAQPPQENCARKRNSAKPNSGRQEAAPQLTPATNQDGSKNQPQPDGQNEPSAAAGSKNSGDLAQSVTEKLQSVAAKLASMVKAATNAPTATGKRTGEPHTPTFL